MSKSRTKYSREYMMKFLNFLKKGIRRKIIAGTVAIILVSFIGLTWLISGQIEKSLIQQRKNKLKQQVNLSVNTINTIIYQEDSLELAREEAKQVVKNMRYGENGYFWINDMQPVMVMHPYKPKLNGQDLSDFHDPNGKYLFNNMVDVVQENGSGFVNYIWQYGDNVDRIEPKISFVKGIDALNWVVGTGSYIVDIKEDVATIRNGIIITEVIIVLLMAGVVFFLTTKVVNPIRKARDIMADISEGKGDYTQRLKIKTQDEVGELANHINNYIAQLQDKEYKLRDELEQREQKYRRLVETTGDMIFIHDKDGFITFANQSTLDHTKYTEEEILGENIKNLVPEDELNSTLERKRKRLEEKYKSRFNFKSAILDKNGDRIEADVQSTPVFEDDEYKSELIMARDITKRKQAQKEKKEIQKQLYQKQKLQSIGTLAGGVAHDFNNLLTVILGMSDLAMKRSNNTEVKSNIKEVRDAGKKAADLTDQLLLFSREKDTEFEIININKTIQALEKMLKRLIGEDISIHDEFEDNIWKIRADEGQLEQIITNMAINAQDAMPEGGDLYLRTQNITIDQEKAQTTPDIQSGSYVRLEIEDTGEGMDEETQDKIFDPFFTTKSRSEGTGMGLSVVHGIVKNHDGLINVYSEPDEGTVFRIYFPAIKKQKETQQNSEQKEKNLDKYKGQGETILVVEDEEPVINYIETILETYDYSYYSVESAEEALDIFEGNQKEIELLLSDMILPGRNGLELADELKDKNPDLNVILSSGYSDNKVSRKEVKNKGHRFVRKPFDIGDLLQSVYEAIHE